MFKILTFSIILMNLVNPPFQDNKELIFLVVSAPELQDTTKNSAVYDSVYVAQLLVKLQKELESQEDSVRINAKNKLVLYGEPAIPYLSKSLMRMTRFNCQLMAAEGLGELARQGSGYALDELYKGLTLTTPFDPWRQDVSAWGLYRAHNLQAMNKMVEVMHCQDGRARRLAIEHILKIGYPLSAIARPTIDSLAESDPSEDVRNTANHALFLIPVGRVGQNVPLTRKGYENVLLLEDPSEMLVFLSRFPKGATATLNDASILIQEQSPFILVVQKYGFPQAVPRDK